MRTQPRPRLSFLVMLGLLIGVMITAPLRTQAQLAVHVASDSSPTSLKQVIESTKQTIAQLQMLNTQNLSRLEMLAEYVKQGSRWLETVQHYAAVVESNLRRFTTLKGIMGFTEQQLGLHEDTLKALAAIGQTVRGIFTIKNQLESLVTTRIRMIRSIEERARAGIFNPSADLDDLEDYLRSSIGRSAEQVIATRARLAEFDNELERWTHDLETYRARRVVVQKLRDETKQLLDEEAARETRPREVSADESGAPINSNPTGGRVSASAQAISDLNKQLFDCDSELTRLDALISELLSKIEERYRKYHMKFDDSHHGAEEVERSNQAWDDFLSIKNQAALDLIDGFHGDTPPRLHPPRPRPH